MSNRILLALVAVLAIAGCASPYQQTDWLTKYNADLNACQGYMGGKMTPYYTCLLHAVENNRDGLNSNEFADLWFAQLQLVILAQDYDAGKITLEQFGEASRRVEMSY